MPAINLKGNPMKTTKNAKRASRRAAPPCSAEICHGPGHQSRTKCQLTGKHDIHYAVYGSYGQVARWRGQRTFSGYFDEPPLEPRQRRKPNKEVSRER
jgi:hypothetical protein